MCTFLFYSVFHLLKRQRREKKVSKKKNDCTSLKWLRDAFCMSEETFFLVNFTVISCNKQMQNKLRRKVDILSEKPTTRIKSNLIKNGTRFDASEVDMSFLNIFFSFFLFCPCKNSSTTRLLSKF